MNTEPLSYTALSRLARTGAIIVLLVSVAVLLGWIADIDALKSIFPDWVAMKVNTAVTFILSAMALWLDGRRPITRKARHASRALAALVMAVGTLTLIEYVFHIEMGIDLWLASDPKSPYLPGRMAPASALAFILVGAALLAPAGSRLTAGLLVPVVVLTGLAMVGYGFGARSLYTVGPYVGMAFLTVFNFIVLTLALFCIRPQAGLIRLMASDTKGGWLTRWLIPSIPLALFLLGLLCHWGERHHWFDEHFAWALMVSLSSLFVIGVLGPVAAMLKRAELAWKNSQQALIALNEQLEREVSKRTAELNSANQQLSGNVMRLEHQATHDTLTGLPNRTLLHDRLTQAIAVAHRREGRAVVVFVDLDKFKWINDTLGHEAGDVLLMEMSHRLVGSVRESDTVARLGGDEFVILLGDELADNEVAALVKRLIDQVAKPVQLRGEEQAISCSIGVSLFPQDGQDAATLLKNADTAMYRAKSLGRNGFQYFTEEMNDTLNRRLQMENELRRALLQDEFELLYQPIVELREGTIIGGETLLRWQHPVWGQVSPAHFIPVAEESDLILQIGEWVILNTCRQIKEWQVMGIPVKPISVNFSTKQFERQDIPALIERLLGETGVAPDLLELEFTESMSMKEPLKSIECIKRLRALGVSVSLDDFGTGYTNLSYLRDFPIHKLKLDASFVCDLTTSPEDVGISKAIIELAHSLHLTIVAEGVERASQMAILRSLGCDQLQGYLFHPALAAQDFADLLVSDQRLVVKMITSAIANETQPRTLLLVDDEKSILSALRRELMGQPYQILQASHANEAFEILATQSVDVILVDQNMPKMTGLELLGKVQKIYPQIVRMVLSGATDGELLISAINQGLVFKFLCKPWNNRELIQAIADAFVKAGNHRANAHDRPPNGLSAVRAVYD